MKKRLSLAETSPDVCNEWHPMKNGDMTPYDVASGSDRKVWWLCKRDKSHEWEAVVSSRKYGAGCPYCAGQKAGPSNCLATQAPRIAEEWHPTKNGILTPKDILPRSSKRVWWLCKKDPTHEWDAIISSRTGGAGCPICAGQRVHQSNSLATLNPMLAKEWHPTKNGTLTPHDVMYGSDKTVWWLCINNPEHEWTAVVKSRKNGSACPICAGRKVHPSTCLAAVAPEYAKEWHHEKNGDLTPNDLTIGSHTVVWWQCQKDPSHEWESTVNRRTSGMSCPYCSNSKLHQTNCLAAVCPDLAAQWHKKRNGTLTPQEVMSNSKKRVWWQCPKESSHVWKTTVNLRYRGSGCPFCSNRKVHMTNCLATVSPVLALEWHPIKNGELTPYDVTSGSTKKMWWRCKIHPLHEWEATVVKRKYNGCPHCSAEMRTSFPEQAFHFYLKKVFESNVYNRLKIEHPLTKDRRKYLEADNYIQQLSVAIEYDGVQHKLERDLEKNKAFKKAGIKLIRVRVPSLPKMEGIPVFIHKFPKRDSSLKKCILDVFQYLAKNFPLSERERETIQDLQQLDIAEDRPRIYAQYLSLIKEKSIAIDQTLKKEWDHEKNKGINPYFISLGSTKQVWWQCQKDPTHRWEAEVYSRSAGNGCPFCSNVKLHPTNCLATVRADLAAQWHPTRNGNLTPNDVVSGTKKRVWWSCPKDVTHEWQAAVSSRVSGTGCPFCSNQKLHISNCLATVKPDLAKEWHPTKNGDKTPFDVTAGSGAKAWWQCLKDKSHEWEAPIKDRGIKSNCPYCSNRKVSLTNCLAATNLNLAKQWHPEKNGRLTPFHLTEGSERAVWWQCPKNPEHEWKVPVYYRKAGNNCPICAGKVVHESNSLATIYPDIAKQWHPTKNGALKPKHVTKASKKKVWWVCRFNPSHEWEATIANRTTRGSGCPRCRKKPL